MAEDEDHANDGDMIPLAASINISMCEHGTLTITLLDLSGAPFAAACMDATTAAEAGRQIDQHVATFRAGGSSTPGCVH